VARSDCTATVGLSFGHCSQPSAGTAKGCVSLTGECCTSGSLFGPAVGSRSLPFCIWHAIRRAWTLSVTGMASSRCSAATKRLGGATSLAEQCSALCNSCSAEPTKDSLAGSFRAKASAAAALPRRSASTLPPTNDACRPRSRANSSSHQGSQPHLLR